MSDSFIGVFKVFGRRKNTFQEGSDIKMTRNLFIIDITCLGLSTTIGTGIFTLLAHAAKHETGPSVVLSFLIAAVASCLGGLCYSELSSRFPEGGPSYVYLYATLGEIWAFFIGWSMIFEYSIASSLAAKSLTSYLNNITNGTLTNIFHIQTSSFSILPGFEGHSLDLSSAIIIISAGALLYLDLKLSCLINNVLVFVCSMVIAGIVMVALSDMDPENWTAGAGFFPNGVNGIFSAASLCFFAFHGYDIIASIAGETSHRIRIVPVGISLAFLLGLVACFSSSVAITLLVPYSLMNDNAPIIQTFTIRGYDSMKYLVIIGATSGLYASIIATLLGLSRLIFTMSSDGLLPGKLSAYNSTKGTTTIATLFALLLSSIVALTVQSSTLFLWLGMGSLLSYMFVSIAILSLRYGLSEQLAIESSELINSDSVNDSSALSSASISPATTALTMATETNHLNQCLECSNHHHQLNSNYYNGSSIDLINRQLMIKNYQTCSSINRGKMSRANDNHEKQLSHPHNLLPRSFSDCLITHRAFTCDTNKCDLCMGRPCLKPNRTFIKGAKMYGTTDKPKEMTVNLLSENKFITSIPNEVNLSESRSLVAQESTGLGISVDDNTTTKNNHKEYDNSPNEKSAQKVSVLLSITMGLMLLMGTLTVHITKYLPPGADLWIELIVTSLFTLIVVLVILIIRQPKHDSNSRNSIPCVPLLPICAIWMDVHLIVCLPSSSWIAFLIWSFIGIFVYMGYSVWHSHESDEDEDEDNSLGIHGLSLNVAIDEENDEIVHCLEDITDGSSV
ncbi:high affinity cationic amino acid transporter 1-like [Panonychus citri]|uniref:high affinity cationic amino acid transporter 1-like n=1 Tax=Panonychus citri TaxID=50023 RepID=UPI0023076502|nr:high affinity cationic amino acid transporter 1-like [Panonychus citri]